MWTMKFQMFNGFRNGRGTIDQIANIVGSSQQQESSRKTLSALLTMPKPLTVWITTNCGKFFKRWEYQTTWPALLRNLYAGQEETVRTGHGTTDWFQTGKGVFQGCILLPCFFNLYAQYIMRNAGLEEAQAGIKIAGRNINVHLRTQLCKLVFPHLSCYKYTTRGEDTEAIPMLLKKLKAFLPT